MSAVDLTIGSTDFYFEENDLNGTELLNESANLLSLGLNLRADYAGWQWRGQFIITDGEADYDGQTQTGTPHQTVTEELILDNLIAARRVVSEQGALRYSVGGGIGYRYWERAIMPRFNPIRNSVVNGLYEEYHWPYLLADTAINYSLNKHNFEFNFGLLRPFSPKVDVEFSESLSLRMQAKLGYKMGLSWSYDADSLRWSAGLEHTRWRFDASNVVNLRDGNRLIGIMEPANEASITRFYLGLGWRF